MAVQIEVVTIQVECLADLFDFVDEPVDLPKTRLLRLIAVKRAELIVVIILNAGGREETVENLQVLVRHTRAAV